MTSGLVYILGIILSGCLLFFFVHYLLHELESSSLDPEKSKLHDNWISRRTQVADRLRCQPGAGRWRLEIELKILRYFITRYRTNSGYNSFSKQRPLFESSPLLHKPGGFGHLTCGGCWKPKSAVEVRSALEEIRQYNNESYSDFGFPKMHFPREIDITSGPERSNPRSRNSGF